MYDYGNMSEQAAALFIAATLAYGASAIHFQLKFLDEERIKALPDLQYSKEEPVDQAYLDGLVYNPDGDEGQIQED